MDGMVGRLALAAVAVAPASPRADSSLVALVLLKRTAVVRGTMSDMGRAGRAMPPGRRETDEL